MFEKKPEYWLVFVQKEGAAKEGNSFYHILTKRWKNINEMPTVNKRTYKVGLSQPTYIWNHKRFYFIDFESGCRYYLEKSFDPSFTPKELDSVISEGIIRDITRGVAENSKEKIIWFVIGAVMGALVCYVFASIYFNDKITTLLQDNIIPEIPNLSVKMVHFL